MAVFAGREQEMLWPGSFKSLGTLPELENSLVGIAIHRDGPKAGICLAATHGKRTSQEINISPMEVLDFDATHRGAQRKAVGGTDKSASHATRLAGTENFKTKYLPEFPTVTILESHPGRVMRLEQLEAMDW